MKAIITKWGSLKQIEFWAVTTIFVFSVFFLITSAVKGGGYIESEYTFEKYRMPFTYLSNYFFPNLVRYSFFYLLFVLFHYSIVPSLLKKNAIALNIFLVIVCYFLLGLILGITDTYLNGYQLARFDSQQEAYNFIFQNSFIYTSWLLLMYGFYLLIRYACEYLLIHTDEISSKYQAINRDGITAFVLWMIAFFLLLLNKTTDGIICIAIGTVPPGICLYWYSLNTLIPQSINRKRPATVYASKMLLLSAAVLLSLMILFFFITQSGNESFIIILFCIAFQVLITAPLSWIVYKRRKSGDEELYILKTALGSSNAKFDFLRSQINPHFLFNALNTIYGTALQENAERTSEGIERLGDMMRFMLQENMQESISLIREIDYLNNYIVLQRLRTDSSPEVKIEAQIDEQLQAFQIPPMLLIPFVENAFKHGISLREPSFIRINLHMKGTQLFFDVSNSIHPKLASDPEKNHSGIGLNNVKQRLQLLFPDKYDLQIRETTKEFFVHLTLTLRNPQTHESHSHR
ncbi:MAG: histidine kinase [Pelobium sp.]